MDLHELMMKRRSVRTFEERSVPDGVLDELLDAAVSAPSGGNVQPISIVTVESVEGRRKLGAIVGSQPWVRNAPLSMIFCLDFLRVGRWAKMFDVEFGGEKALLWFLIGYADLMCAAQNVVILAEERGLGSVYVGTILSQIPRARKYFDIPEGVLPMMVLSIGYPKAVPKTIPKLPRDAMVHREKYRTQTDEEIRRAFEDKYGTIDEDVVKYFERAYREAVEADGQQDGGWVEDAKARMDRLGIKSNAEFLFRLRYPSELMIELNEDLVRDFREAGFDLSSLTKS